MKHTVNQGIHLSQSLPVHFDLKASKHNFHLFLSLLGGNLMVALTLKLIKEGIRLPDGLVIAYPPLRVQYAPSPSRMLALMDPLLPPGILKVCLRAYAGNVHADTIKDSSSTSSLRTAVFDDFYNPFDLDLGDVAYAARKRNETIITGKRSYSDTNLVTGEHYCLSKPAAGCFRCKTMKNRSQHLRKASVVSESDAEECGLQMHPIQGMDKRLPTEGSFYNADLTNASDPVGNGTVTIDGVNVDKVTVNNTIESDNRLSGKTFVPTSHQDLDTSKKALSDSNSVQESENVANSNSSGECEGGFSVTSEADTVEYVVTRKSRSNTIQSHRRSLSDSIAESFQRLRPSPDDFEIARQLSNMEVEDGRVREKRGSRSLSPIEQENLPVTERTKEINHKVHDSGGAPVGYKALYIKETSDCVIIDREGKAATSVSITEKFEKVYERQGSINSISSSVKRISRDPLMSPLLASDELLRKLPKLIIVVSIKEFSLISAL